MEEQTERQINEEERNKEEQKRKLVEKLKLLRMNSLKQNKMSEALRQRHRYRFTRGGKTKRS